MRLRTPALLLRSTGLSLALGLVPLALAAPAGAAAPDSLQEGFREPPSEARPRVWWHWMDGMITKDGIRKDLEWMKRIGVGGVQQFDASMMTAKVIDKPLPYMSDGWKDAFRYAVTTADELGLDFAVAASPGFSETGGPWVPSRDGMKKLVWSETLVAGGKRFNAVLPQPPVTPGPYQNMSRAQIDGLGKTAKPIEPFYADVGVFAYPVEAPRLPAPALANGAGQALDAALLGDARFDKGLAVPAGAADRFGGIVASFDAPRTIRSATMHIEGKTALSEINLAPVLESSDDGKTWRAVAAMPIEIVPTTVSFAPVTARWFRLSLAPSVKVGLSTNPAAPGATAAMMLGGQPSAPKTAKVTEFTLSGEARIDRVEAKAGFAATHDYRELKHAGPADEAGIAPASVINLTGRMKADGTLDWTAPKGTWRILRIGTSLTGATNHPAPIEATGLEVDKLDAGAVRRYMETYLGMYRQIVGPDLIGKRGIRGLLNDSIEAGDANWTGAMIDQFKRLRGYDPTPWLPALTGAIVQSRAASDAFLYDFRQTLADLIADQHYGTIAKVAHENGLIHFSESLEGGRTQLGDDMAMRSHADVPMAAMWSFDAKSGPKPGYVIDIKGAASLAHLYGRKTVAVESLTALARPWADSPANLRHAIDLEYATGANLPVIQTSVHQPTDRVPGLPFFIINQDFFRLNSWAEMAKPWTDYMARTSYLLQQGRNVADVAYFYGEEPPLVGQFAQGPVADAPVRHAYDFVHADGLAMLRAEDGEIVSSGGARYRLLYLGAAARRMTLPVLRQVARLVDEGATVLGEPPAGSSALKDDAAEYRALVGRIWSGTGSKGRVISGLGVEAGLAKAGVMPDFSYGKAQPDSEVLFVHRKLDDGEVYFLSNRRSRAETTEARFRVIGKAPQIWRADSGRIEPVSYRIEGNETVVPLSFEAEESYFVVFRDPALAPEGKVAQPVLATAATLGGPWTVAFQADRGAPATATLPALGSLSENADPGIKYFSGTSTYSRSFALPRGVRPGAPLWLDLGQVGDIAEVRVNGQLVGSAWHAPYRLDIGGAVKRGRNQLEVRVANLWVNRLIGDAQPGAKKVTVTNTPTYRRDAPLRPSGLIGPVQLLAGTASGK